MKDLLMPQRIVAYESVDRVERLLDDEPLQATPINPCNSAAGYTTIKKGGWVLIDFCREIRGGVVICVRDISSFPAAAKCRLVFGESVMEALSSIGYKNATNDHAIRDTVIDVPIMGNVRFGNTGYRFLKIEALDADVVIRSLRAELDVYDVDEIGSFECSDSRLNEIWQTGAYTVRLNMGEYVWDGVKRDRMIWLGDLHPEASVIYAAFGSDESIRRSLERTRMEYPDGKWINTLPSYSFWWIINLYDWYMHSGDIEYLKSSLDYVRVIAKLAYEVVTENPVNFGFFVDWSSAGDEATKRFGFYCVMYKAFVCASKIADTLGDAELSELAARGMTAVRALDLSLPNQKQMAGIAAYSGLKSASEVNDSVLSRDPLQGLSTFMGYYVLLAKGAAGDVRGALDIIRSFWGAMLDLGATTFWEDFDIEWVKDAARIDEITPEGKKDVHGDNGKECYVGYRHSLCHGWAGGPAAFLSQYVLGVNVAEPGCKKLVIKSSLGDLEWARGTFPTPYGAVKIEHKRDGERIISTVDAPKEVEIELIP
jgi:hypothetical protein